MKRLKSNNRIGQRLPQNLDCLISAAWGSIGLKRSRTANISVSFAGEFLSLFTAMFVDPFPLSRGFKHCFSPGKLIIHLIYRFALNYRHLLFKTSECII